MEKYRQKLKILRIIYSISTFFMFAIYILFWVLTELEASPIPTPTFMIGSYEFVLNRFISIIGFTQGISFIQEIKRITKALNNDEELKKMHIRENDERALLLHAKSNSMATRIFTIIALPVSLIIGYFNITIFLTVWACLLAQIIIGDICRSYYEKRF